MNTRLYQYLFKFQFRKTRHDVHVVLWLRHQNIVDVFGLNCSNCLQAAFNEIAMKWCSFWCHQEINRKTLEAQKIHYGVQNSSSYFSPCFQFFYEEKFVNKINGILNVHSSRLLFNAWCYAIRDNISLNLFNISLVRKTIWKSCLTYSFDDILNDRFTNV